MKPVTKFRAWDKRENCWRHDVVLTGGSVFIARTSEDFQKLVDTWYKSKGTILGGDYAEIDYTDWYAIECIDVQLWTGRKDAEGKEIYVGDIFFSKFLNRNVSVEWDEVFCQFVANGLEFGVEVSPDSILIIGNIYENPELLNQGEKSERSVATDDASSTTADNQNIHY